jgi:hypothetical protein
MRRLTIRDVHLALNDLTGTRRAILTASRAGAYYLTDIEALQTQVAALPEELVGTPHAEAISKLDAEHDGFGAEIWYYFKAVERRPDAPVDDLAAGQRILAALVPNLAELQAPLATEGDRALHRRPVLISLRADLMRFPRAGGGTMLDAATSMLDRGEQIIAKLAERATITADARRNANRLRNEALALFSDLRKQAVKQAAAHGSTLPAQYEAKLFAYIDLLTDFRNAQASARDRLATNAAPSAPETPPTPPPAGAVAHTPAPAGGSTPGGTAPQRT